MKTAVVAALVLFVGPVALAASDIQPCQPQPSCQKPTPVPPLWPQGRCDRCNDIPVDRYTMICPVGQAAICVTAKSFPPLPKCPLVTFGYCADAPVFGTVVPNFQVTYVVYSPPGRGSSVNYSQGATLGSSTSLSQGGSNATDFGVMIGADVIIASGQMNVNTNFTVAGTVAKQQDVSLDLTQGLRVPGQGDFVNHDYDQIWFMVKPAIHIKLQDRPGTTEVSWQYADGQQVTQFWVYAGEMAGHLAIPPDIKAQLDVWAITPAEYPALLAADPFFGPQATTGPLDPDRFSLVQVLPYRPLGSASEQPTTITYSTQQKTTGSTTVEETQGYSVGATWMGEVKFILKARLTVGDRVTFTNKTSLKLSNGSTTTDSLTLGQPSFGYAGPVVLAVYVDKLWHTYAFRLE